MRSPVAEAKINTTSKLEKVANAVGQVKNKNKTS